jgi:hypothetical protein
MCASDVGLQANSADRMRLLDLVLRTSVEEGTPNALLEAQELVAYVWDLWDLELP